MAELLVRIRDSATTGDPAFDAQVSRRGDVIVARDNGWEWSPQECANPDWRILKFPNVSLDAAKTLESPEVPFTSEDLQYLQFRGFYFNVDAVALPPEVAANIADDQRQAQSITSTMSEADFVRFIVRRDPILRDGTAAAGDTVG